MNENSSINMVFVDLVEKLNKTTSNVCIELQVESVEHCFCGQPHRGVQYKGVTESSMCDGQLDSKQASGFASHPPDKGYAASAARHRTRMGGVSVRR